MLSNLANLPLPMVVAAEDKHISSGSNLSLTSVYAPAKQIALQKLHAAEIHEDASDRIWSLLGQAVHTILERAADHDAIMTFAEQRWERTVLGWRVAGRIDHLTLEPSLRALTDYKVTSVWSVKDGAKTDWVIQMNLQYLLAPDALRAQIDKLQVCALLRDWRKNEALRYGDDYPERQVVVVPIPMWPLEKTAAYLEERVALHQQAQLQNVLPDCTPEERWEQPTTYAVCKKGNKTATRLYQDRALADQHAAAQPNLEVRVRPGKSPRCEQYCAALPFCTQGQAVVAATKEAAA
jgi:hypothetical protein